MFNRYFSYCILLAGILLCSVTNAQTIHPYGLEQMISVADDDLIGTTRFIGLAGAMTAVGGDPSAVLRNPAGLGIYRHSQFSVSAAGTFRRFVPSTGADNGVWYDRWHLSQISYVVALTHPERVAGIISNNIMISYNRRADIMCNVRLNDNSARRSEPNWIETTIDEYGHRHDVDIHYAMNINNSVYWGLGMTVEWLETRQTIDRWEYAAVDKRGQEREYDLVKTTQGKGVGWGASLGVLVRPVQFLRIGASVESPVIGKMRETDYYTETIRYPGTTGKDEKYESPTYNSNWRMLTPLNASAGVGLQWTTHGLLSLQYDLRYHKLSGISQTARAGLEVAMTNHWFLDAGYAYTTSYTRHRGSIGLHYLGNWLRVGLAYSFSWSKAMVMDSLYYTEQGTYTTRENRIVFSFQWNS